MQRYRMRKKDPEKKVVLYGESLGMLIQRHAEGRS